jgi:CheY-like chemotaxis protein
MDRRMPVMDGIEATLAIRRLEEGKEVKIVAVTASAFIEQREEMLAAGMDDFVRKPYRTHEIYECLERHLGLRWVYAAMPAAEAPASALTPASLAPLPEALRHELKAALESLETERIANAIARVGTYDPTLETALSQLAGELDYPAILNALKG